MELRLFSVLLFFICTAYKLLALILYPNVEKKNKKKISPKQENPSNFLSRIFILIVGVKSSPFFS